MTDSYSGEDGYVERKTTSAEHQFVFEDLVDATKYNIEAKTYLEAADLGFSNETIHALICKFSLDSSC